MRELLIPYGSSGLRRLIMAHALTGQKLVEQTATGNPATFMATAAKPLIQCQAAFSPVQSGSGDPSPENVRPITGWTGVNVYHSGENTSDPTTYPVTWTSAGTVYGGYVDLVSGVLVKTKEYILADGSITWSYLPSGGLSRFNTNPSVYSKGAAKNGSTATIRFNFFKSSSSALEYNGYVGSTGNILCYMPSDIDTAAKFSTYLSEHNLEICYELATPEEYQLTPTIINTLKGTNNLWSDANGNIAVKYLTKGA